MILEIDVGNSRSKWRMVEGDGVVLQRGVATGGPDLNVVIGTPSRIRVVSVRGEAFNQQLMELLLIKWGVTPEFGLAAVSCANVINGYTEPEKLGVDRWLAVISAYNDCRKACCVIDAGSAITLDSVTYDGHHSGGFIVPGLDLQRRALLAGTRIELVVTARWEQVSVGVSTMDAIHNGILSMVVDWLVREVANLDVQASSVVYLTGGDAALLSKQLLRRNIPHTVVPDLVLDGLKFALP